MTAPVLPGIVHDGNYLVSFVPTIANINAPTVAELNAGIALETQTKPDGLNREASDEGVDNSRLSSVFTTMQVGRTGFEVSLTLVRLDVNDPSVTADEAYDTLVKGLRGFIVIRDNAPSTQVYAAGDEVEVYPVQCGTRNKPAPAANELQTFTVPFMVTADPALAATVAA